MRACATNTIDPHPVASEHAIRCLLCWESLHSLNPRVRQKLGGNGWIPPTTPRPGPVTAEPLRPIHTDGRVRVNWCKRRGLFDWVVMSDDGRTLASGSEAYLEQAQEEAHVAQADLELSGAFGNRWAYGVTTVGKASEQWAKHGFKTVQERGGLLQRTLASLRRTGFDTPHLFVDGAEEGFKFLGLPTTYRNPAVLTWGNWFLSLGELVIREPFARWYAIFQDDIVTSTGLKEYIERSDLPADAYLNLYTAPVNEGAAAGREGWYEAPVTHVDVEGRQLQGGQGALALVLPRDAALAILTSPHANRKALDPRPEFRHKKADGGVVTALNYAGWREWVHAPSLVQHTGIESSMGNGIVPTSTTFRGEAFNLLSLLEKA